jgi:tryptophan 2,3-dioxygenase
MPDARVPTYWDYLKLDRLLALQTGLGDDDAALASDELHFIVVHQVYELWFKLVLRELRLARDHLAAPRVPEETVPHVVHHLGRINEILQLAVDQFRVMETLTPQDFLDFRDKLTPASGFQSFQMREIEVLLGLDDSDRVADARAALSHLKTQATATPAGRLALERIDAARGETTLRAALHDWLYRTPIEGSGPQDAGDAQVVDAFLAAYVASLEREQQAQVERVLATQGGDAAAVRSRVADTTRQARDFLLGQDVPAGARARTRRIRAGLLFVESYRELPLLAWPRLLIDTIVEMEEQLVLWRTRHARMVERTIGRRMGTGGSAGVDYLDQTARYRIFTELWAVRTLLLPRRALPPLRNAEAYGFAR